MPKVFFLDNGIRNQLFGGFAPALGRSDRGALFENLVFCEIYKHLNPLLDSVRYWRTKSKAEVDFVIEHQGRILPCEAKATAIRGKVSRSARSFIEAYQPPRFLMVHTGPRASIDIGATRVDFLGLPDLSEAILRFLDRTAPTAS